MITEFMIEMEQEQIPVEVIRSKRRSMALEIRSDGSVLARAPLRVSDRTLRKFVASHARWIYEKRQRMFERRQQLAQHPYEFPVWEEMTTAQKKEVKEVITRRVVYYAQQMGVDYSGISVRNQKSRWGSCSAKGNLNFNYRLAYLPADLLDYVVVHELAHRRHMDHSAAFWQEVADYFPDYKQCRRRLSDILLS